MFDSLAALAGLCRDRVMQLTLNAPELEPLTLPRDRLAIEPFPL